MRWCSTVLRVTCSAFLFCRQKLAAVNDGLFTSRLPVILQLFTNDELVFPSAVIVYDKSILSLHTAALHGHSMLQLDTVTVHCHSLLSDT